MKKIFLSHAYVDRKIAERIVDKLLVETLHISKSDIFFTSKRDTGIPSSVAWRDHIKTELKSCPIFIALITPNYHKSQMCLAEIGAAWALDKTIYSTYLSPITVHNFSVVIGERQADNLRNKDEVNSFINTLATNIDKVFNTEISRTEFEKGIIKFDKSLRGYLKRNSSELGLDYFENKIEKKQSKPNLKQIDLVPFDIEIAKKKAQEEYPEDYSMQEYVIKEQKEGYSELENLLNINKDIPELPKIFQRATNEYQSDYSMIVYTMKEQLDSLQRLKNN